MSDIMDRLLDATDRDAVSDAQEEIAALRAENERLSTYAKRAAMDVLLCKDGNILLHEENERLKEWNREIALNAREFAAENERLRAALEDIAYPNPDHGEDQLMQIARAALEDKTND